MEEKKPLVQNNFQTSEEFQPENFSDSFSLNRIQKNLRSLQPKRIIKLIQFLKNFVIVNLFFDIALILNFIRPKFYENFKNNCRLQLEFADFLDLLINCCLLALLNFYSFAYKSVFKTNIKIIVFFSLGFLTLWSAIKFSYYQIHKQNQNCLFLSFYEYLIQKFFFNDFVVTFTIETILICFVITMFIRSYNQKYFLRSEHLIYYEKKVQQLIFIKHTIFK